MSPFLRWLADNARRRRAEKNALILANPAPGYPYGRCGYCGVKTPYLAAACVEHADLPAADPFLNPHVVFADREPARDFRPEALLDRLTTQGA